MPNDLTLTVPESAGLAKMKPDQLIELHTRLLSLEKQAKAIKEEISNLLKAEVSTKGKPEGLKGHLRSEFSTGFAVLERRVSSLPSADKLASLLSSKGIDLEAVCEKVTDYVISPQRIRNLIATGAITEEEIAAITDITWALKIRPSNT